MSKNNNDKSLPISLNLKESNPLPKTTQKYFSICKEKLGIIPNVLKAYSHNIEKLNTFTAMYNELMLGKSGLSNLEREMIAVVVSSINRCYYCQVAHGASVRQISKKPELGERLVMNFKTADLNSREKSMLNFASKLTKKSYAISEKDRQKLRKNGFSDSDIWDIASVVGFFNMSNRVASATKMEPNEEYHSMAR